ncbi:hypothetical protein KIL84_000147 [Mauremys mutica]|uniref:Uncharacterized protein n=1 Tax=Mauremys mutica TaxID=74926 RepID=A0A9D4B3A1_9SAUR|nr:hypothetical protein KIL84_000147 [Mauremys mutica]
MRCRPERGKQGTLGMTWLPTRPPLQLPLPDARLTAQSNAPSHTHTNAPKPAPASASPLLMQAPSPLPSLFPAGCRLQGKAEVPSPGRSFLPAWCTIGEGVRPWLPEPRRACKANSLGLRVSHLEPQISNSCSPLNKPYSDL